MWYAFFFIFALLFSTIKRSIWTSGSLSVSLLSCFCRSSVGKSVGIFAKLICENSVWTYSPHGFFFYYWPSVEHKCTLMFANVLDNWKSEGHVGVIACYMICWPHALCRGTRGLTCFVKVIYRNMEINIELLISFRNVLQVNVVEWQISQK